MEDIDLTLFDDLLPKQFQKSVCDECGGVNGEQCYACHPPYPKGGESYDIIFAVDLSGFGWLVDADDAVRNYMTEASVQANMDEGGFENLPEDAGLYRATAKFDVYTCGSWDSPDIGARFFIENPVRIFPEKEGGGGS
jgi:hypothetical protein